MIGKAQLFTAHPFHVVDNRNFEMDLGISSQRTSLQTEKRGAGQVNVTFDDAKSVVEPDYLSFCTQETKYQCQKQRLM